MGYEADTVEKIIMTLIELNQGSIKSRFHICLRQGEQLSSDEEVPITKGAGAMLMNGGSSVVFPLKVPPHFLSPTGV